MRIKVKAETDSYVFGKLYAANHLRADRGYKLGRTLLYGRLEDEKAFNTVRRLVQYEDYVLRLLCDAGLPAPRPYGSAELTPEREYLLVMEFFDGATELGEAGVDDAIIDQGLRVVRRMWEAGLAHRDIKPANILVRDRTLLLLDSAFAQLRPSPWRQAVDLANMTLVLGLRTSAERVYGRTRIYFSDTEIAEAFAATRGLTMPSQLRACCARRDRTCTPSSSHCCRTGCRRCASILRSIRRDPGSIGASPIRSMSRGSRNRLRLINLVLSLVGTSTNDHTQLPSSERHARTRPGSARSNRIRLAPKPIVSPMCGVWNSGSTRSALCILSPSRFSIQS